MQDKREQQLRYELESDAAVQAEHLQQLITAAESGDPSLPRASALIARMAGVVRNVLQTYTDTITRGKGALYKKWLRALPTDVAAVMSLRECIRQCGGLNGSSDVQELTFELGRLWVLEVRIREAEKVNPVYMQKVHDQTEERGSTNLGHLRRRYSAVIEKVTQGQLSMDFSRSDYMHIGKFGVDACYEAGLLEIDRTYGKGGSVVTYRLAEDVREFLLGYDGSDVRRLISKADSRMMCEPDTWSNLGDGGYVSVRRKAAAPLLQVHKMRKSIRKDLLDEFTAEKMPLVFEAGNYLQSRAMQIHGPTRDAIVRVWNSGGGVLGVPKRDAPVKPEFPFGDDFDRESASEHEQALFQRWKRFTAVWYDEMRKWRSKVKECGSFVRSMGTESHPTWFPVFFDSRGRWYYRGSPNPQGSDMSKAVLHMHRKKPLGHRGLFWLKVHIANSFGYDKERMLDRARWTEQNWPSIERALDDPENHPDVWGKDAPWCMFSAAWELREAYRSGNPEAYCTGVIVHMDATCSGLQHFSALLRDEVGGMYVNLTDPMMCGPKQDIYGRVGTVALKAVQLDLESTDPAVRELAQWVIDVGIPRALAKKPVMTYVYGATLRGTASFVEYTMDKEILPELGKTWLDPVLSYKHSVYIAKKLFQGVAATVPAADAAMRWLRGVAGQMPSGKRMQWRTPTGFLVQHDYQTFEDTRVRLNSCGVTQILVRDWTDGTDPVQMRNSISPNFVHALDASHLTLVALAMQRQGLDMVGIHDSFGTHACDVDAMQQSIREEFVRMYDKNLLADFLWEVGGIGEVPSMGKLQLQDVLESEFFFS